MSDQRSRLFRALVRIVARDGVAHAKIADVTRTAGVSLATFYELFDGKEHCVVEAQRFFGQRMIAQLPDADRCVRHSPIWGMLDGLIQFAETEPDAFVFVALDAALVGRLAVDEHQRLMSRLRLPIEDAALRAPAAEVEPDLPAAALVGGPMRTLAIHVRRGERRPSELRDELRQWIACYECPPAERRTGRLLELGHLLDVLDHDVPIPAWPLAVPNGRHRIPTATVARACRERLLYATAQAISERGCGHVTVANIVEMAGLSREVFYRYFRDRHDAAERTLEFFFGHMMGVTAGAFYRHGNWPEQIWSAGRAFVRQIVAAPKLARFTFIECYGLGPRAARQTDEYVFAFACFLAGRAPPDARPPEPPSIAPAAIAATVHDLIAQHIRQGTVFDLPYLLPLMSYIVLTPFMGTDRTYEFIKSRANAPVSAHASVAARASVPGEENSPDTAVQLRIRA